jgi:hypothetical protein
MQDDIDIGERVHTNLLDALNESQVSDATKSLLAPIIDKVASTVERMCPALLGHSSKDKFRFATAYGPDVAPGHLLLVMSNNIDAPMVGEMEYQRFYELLDWALASRCEVADPQSCRAAMHDFINEQQYDRAVECFALSITDIPGFKAQMLSHREEADRLRLVVLLVGIGYQVDGKVGGMTACMYLPTPLREQMIQTGLI